MIKIKEGFKEERFVSLPVELLLKYSLDPLIGNLYLRKIGFFPKVKYHYVQKERGTDYAILIYCVGGRGWYEINNIHYEIEANQFIIIPKDTAYSFGADESDPWTIYWLHFQGIMADRFYLPDPVPVSVLPGEGSRVQERIQLFEEIYSSFSMGYNKENMVYCSMCLYMFMASFRWIGQYEHVNMPDDSQPSFSSKVIWYMEENVASNLTLSSLASYFKYSPSHFSMLFHKETGISPINYFLRLKIQKACQYIALTDLKINEISIKLGFEEPAYFSRLFTKIMGMPPSAYRKKESEHTAQV